MKQKRRLKATEQPKKNVSASKRIYADLRQRIVGMVLLPGSRIVEHEIAVEHGTSRTPVHEAVQRLAEEGLIEVRPRVGTFVSRIPLSGLEEVMLVRTALERAVVIKATERATTNDIKILRDILHQQSTFINAKDQKGFHATDEAFHEAISRAAEHPGVWPIILQAKTQVDRYRQLTLHIPGRMVQIFDEHTEILSSIEEGDSNRAQEAMDRHLAHLLPSIEDTQIKYPDYFVGSLPKHRPREIIGINKPLTIKNRQPI